MKLTDKQTNIMRLIRRSTPSGGWYTVSKAVWPLVESADIPSDLLEVRLSDGAHSVRLTPNGEVVMKYLV